MERYTYFDGGKWRLKIGDTEYSGKAVDRLAAYEDTGLEPEDIKQAFNEDAVLKLAGQVLSVTPDRLREMAQADREGKIHIGRCLDCRNYEGLAVCKLIGDCGGTNFFCGWFEPKLSELPAADVAPVRHGRWYDKGALSCRCSECGCKSNRESNYCPNCGALMKEADHEAG